VTNARLLGSAGFRSAPSPSRPRPFHHATARSSRADYIAQTRPVPLGRWPRRSATSGVFTPSETLRFLRRHPNRSAFFDEFEILYAIAMHNHAALQIPALTAAGM